MSSFITFIFGIILIGAALIQSYLRNQTPLEKRNGLQLVSLNATGFIGGFMITTAILHSVGI